MSVILTPLYVCELVYMHILILCICFCAHVCTRLFMYSYLCVQILMFIWICLRVFVCLHVYELLIFVYTVHNYKSIKNFQKNICHHPGLFFWVHLAGWKKKLSFWDGKIALILIYNLFVTKKIFFWNEHQKKFLTHPFLVDPVGWQQTNIFLSLA